MPFENACPLCLYAFDTPESEDAAEGLHQAVIEQQVPAHTRRTRKKRDESLG